jgi:hypothetical protein
VGESIDAPVSCEEVDDGTTAAVSCDEAPRYVLDGIRPSFLAL